MTNQLSLPLISSINREWVTTIKNDTKTVINDKTAMEKTESKLVISTQFFPKRSEQHLSPSPTTSPSTKQATSRKMKMSLIPSDGMLPAHVKEVENFEISELIGRSAAAHRLLAGMLGFLLGFLSLLSSLAINWILGYRFGDTNSSSLEGPSSGSYGRVDFWFNVWCWIITIALTFYLWVAFLVSRRIGGRRYVGFLSLECTGAAGMVAGVYAAFVCTNFLLGIKPDAADLLTTYIGLALHSLLFLGGVLLQLCASEQDNNDETYDVDDNDMTAMC